MPSEKISILFERALSLSPSDREALLREIESTDPTASAELGSLLSSHDSALGFMETGLKSDLAKVLSEEKFKPFRLNRYLVVEKLGRGGMAHVVRALIKGPGGFLKQLAIKQVLAGSVTPETEAMFEEEARLCSQLTHPNIVHVYEFLHVDSACLLAMEFVEGQNLAQVALRHKKATSLSSLPLPFAVYVINEVCKGLAYAHHKRENITGALLNIVHRDISPQNIMVSYEGAVKVLDFGIAKSRHRLDYTHSGLIRGKISYLSPEQASGQTVDHRSDIFSTALVLYELLTGERVFRADIDQATLSLIQQCKIPSPREKNTAIPAELERIVLKALAKTVTARYQDICEMQADLQSFLNAEYPRFGPRDIAGFMQTSFDKEIEQRKRKHAEEEALCAQALDSGIDGAGSKTEPRENPPTRLMRFGFGTEVSLKRIGAAVSVPLGVFVVLLLYTDVRTKIDERERVSVRRQHRMMPKRDPVSLPIASPSTAKPDPAPVLCEVRILSEPPGAALVLGGKSAGVTPNVTSGPCDASIEASLALEGYEVATERFKLTPGATKRFLLTKIPMGFLELTLNRDARVLDGDELLVEVKGRQKFKLSLRARRVHSLTFVSTATGEVLQQEFVVTEGTVAKRVVTFRD